MSSSSPNGGEEPWEGQQATVRWLTRARVLRHWRNSSRIRTAEATVGGLPLRRQGCTQSENKGIGLGVGSGRFDLSFEPGIVLGGIF